MNKLFSKSSKGLLENSSIGLLTLDRKLEFLLSEQRKQRADLVDLKRMINRLLIDEHLEQQVDKYFEDHESS